LIAGLPDDYDARAAALATLRRVTHEEIAAALEPALNRRLEAMPHDDLMAKRELAIWTNEQIKRLGLAIRCKRTGRPAILLGAADKAGDTEGRFRLELRDEDNRVIRTLSKRRLPHLELMEHPVRAESFSARYRRRTQSEPPER
jgi:hypothetical protein